MQPNIIGSWAGSIIQYSQTLENTTFQKLDLFPSSVVGERQLLCRTLRKCYPQSMNSHEVEVAVNLWPTVSRPVCLGVRRPSGTFHQFSFLLEISFRHLRVCYFIAPSLTRGRVCNLLYNCFWALPEQSLLGRSPAELTTIFYSHLRLLQPGGPGPHIYNPQEQGGPVPCQWTTAI
jgi:hypothetical protein